jgi:hypothetical protein
MCVCVCARVRAIFAYICMEEFELGQGLCRSYPSIDKYPPFMFSWSVSYCDCVGNQIGREVVTASGYVRLDLLRYGRINDTGELEIDFDTRGGQLVTRNLNEPLPRSITRIFTALGRALVTKPPFTVTVPRHITSP